MSLFGTNHVCKRSPLKNTLQGFARDEDGSVTILAIFMIFMMVMVGGIQLDFMRHELERSKLQAVSDRAVLAAADLDQGRDPETVVKDYFAKSGMSEYLSKTVVDQGLNYRIVTVDASKDMPTQFISRFGFDTLKVPAHSQAEERVEKVEVSLVLDISGSMGENGRIQNLRDAASIFVDSVLKAGNKDRISISLVPYSGQVNAGPDILDRMNVRRLHGYSDCIEFDSNEFDTVFLDTNKWHDQTQHFQWNYWSPNDRTATLCPRYSFERIAPLSQNVTKLKDQIKAFQPRARTSIFLGMKWGVSMLDPSFRSINNSLVLAGKVDAKFLNRPANYSDKETLKTVVLMTDGENTEIV